jgi:uncharacterized membrane protein
MQLQIVQFITLSLILLVTGVFFGPWLALHRTLDVFTKAEFLKITKAMAINLGRPMQILMPLCLLFMLITVILFPYKNHISFYLFIASFFCFVITLIVTLTTELPIVNKIKLWTNDTAPENWEEIRNRWVSFHALRVFPALFGFVLYLLGIFCQF